MDLGLRGKVRRAAAVGGLLWKLEPQATFIVAGLIGIVGTIDFAATVEERYAG